MIDHKSKIIFIHIPKCAGSSIEYYFGVKPFNWKIPNYTNLTGWCPDRKIHLHHATAAQLLETNLVSREIWEGYTKFTIVRNPWSRAVSDYYWIMNDCKLKGSFKSYILAENQFARVMKNYQDKTYRGDHLTCQTDFIEVNGKMELDNVLRFENLKEDFKKFSEENNLPSLPLPHAKKGRKRMNHYSHFYNTQKIELVRERYLKDIQNFDYEFEDLRDELSYWERLRFKLSI